jgi:hypothetical protein
MQVAIVPAFFKMVFNTVTAIMGTAGVAQVIGPNVSAQGMIANAMHVASTSLFAPSTASVISIGPIASASLGASAGRVPASRHLRTEVEVSARTASPGKRENTFLGVARHSTDTAEAKTALNQTATIVVPVFFKMVFITVTVITVSAGAAQVMMAMGWQQPTPNEQSVFEAMGFTWKAGIGAIFGLLGGKVL